MSGNGHTDADATASGIVVMAASYGGVKAYRSLLAALPPTFPWPILLVQHRHPDADFVAPLLSRTTPLSVAAVCAGERPRAGTVYVLPPDRQTIVDGNGCFAFTPASRGEADPLLASVAFAYGERALAVILTGRLNDGTAGVRAVKQRGGRVLVQDEESSEAFAMPAAAIATGCADFVLPLRSIAPALVSLVMAPGGAELFRVRLSPWAAVPAG